MALTDVKCRGTKPTEKTQKLSDGGGLFLQVNPNGSKLWRCAYRWDGKQRLAAFGRYPEASLADARQKRADLKALLASGIDPSKATTPLPVEHPFKQVTELWFKANEARWEPSYSTRLWARLRDDAIPDLGEKDVKAITPQEVLATLRKIEERNAIEMAKRVRFAISSVFKYAIAEGWCSLDPTTSLASALKAAPEPKRRAALNAKELPTFLARLSHYPGRQTALALKLVAHTFVRSAEIRFATWDEFDGETWNIPGSRMKMGLDHLVPLTTQAKGILAELKEIAAGSKWVLPGERGYKPISENTLIYSLYRMGHHSRATIHGFRATASTILNESGLFRPDVIERQLAHVPQNEVRAAYNRALYIKERREMMAWYSDYIDAAEREGMKHDLTELLE
ncbi:tyrosine-type recombinase/integrase [Ancylobacter defluvii]|uniref:Integrase n=1 Tax=Ancylobacter defluvii TaxID=1282440 RepID=A0A9W6NAM6_9HYPH|nr:integrase arm-type DNA-binding domain-containing protein [Ancylobacter defluvii]MBS7589046.1 integrase arm-type DNA-binding domain-containing protein [Ancylobacter defluvii]GLK84654.1 integrase [Ancylobacter defluvii]